MLARLRLAYPAAQTKHLAGSHAPQISGMLKNDCTACPGWGWLHPWVSPAFLGGSLLAQTSPPPASCASCSSSSLALSLYPGTRQKLPRDAVLPSKSKKRKKKKGWENKLHMMDVSHVAYCTAGTLSTRGAYTYIQDLGMSQASRICTSGWFEHMQNMVGTSWYTNMFFYFPLCL